MSECASEKMKRKITCSHCNVQRGNGGPTSDTAVSGCVCMYVCMCVCICLWLCGVHVLYIMRVHDYAILTFVCMFVNRIQ